MPSSPTWTRSALMAGVRCRTSRSRARCCMCFARAARCRTELAVSFLRQSKYAFLARICSLRIVKQTVAPLLDAATKRVAVVFIRSYGNDQIDVVALVQGNQLLEPDAAQDAAGQPAAHKPPLARDDGQTAFHCLHGCVETGKADGVEHDVGSFHNLVVGSPFLPRQHDTCVREA